MDNRLGLYFYELSAEAKKKAIEEERETIRGRFDWEWWQYTVESFVNEVSILDFYIEARDVEFSGFYSKGDGASFTGRFDPSEEAINAFLSGKNNYYSSLVKDSPWGSIKDLAGWMDDCLTKVFSEELLGHPDIECIGELGIDVKRLPSRYSHENTMQTYGSLSFGCEDDSSTIDLDEMERIEAKVMHMLEESEGMFRKVAVELFGALRDEYEYLDSDEHIEDYLECFGNLYKEDGTLFDG